MLELRGPSRITNELEKAILRTEVGNISYVLTAAIHGLETDSYTQVFAL
jgi:hypothetical protein